MVLRNYVDKARSSGLIPEKEDKMKKITVAVMAACVLFCLSSQLMAKNCEIPIKITQGKIDMGDKYALTVSPEDNIKWTCDLTFEVVFESDAPFEQVSTTDSKVKEKKVNSTAPLYRVYKYTVIVVDGNCRLFILDPIIIVIPPGN